MVKPNNSLWGFTQFILFILLLKLYLYKQIGYLTINALSLIISFDIITFNSIKIFRRNQEVQPNAQILNFIQRSQPYF